MAGKYEEMMKAKGLLPYYLDNLPPNLIQKAKDELGETDEIRCSALKQFRTCILADKKLKFPTDDEFLIQFLRARKYNVDKALDLLKNFFNLIISHPEFFDKLDKEKMDKIARSRLIKALSFRDKDGCLVAIVMMDKWDPDVISVQVVLCTIIAIIFCISIYPANQITGVRLIFDAKGYTFKQMRQFVPRYIPLISKALRNSLPFRFKGIHVINETNIFQCTWSVLKIFLSKKIRSRIYLHGDNKKDLYKFIPKEVLPLDYGGDGGNDVDWLSKELDKFHYNYTTIIKNCFS